MQVGFFYTCILEVILPWKSRMCDLLNYLTACMSLCFFFKFKYFDFLNVLKNIDVFLIRKKLTEGKQINLKWKSYGNHQQRPKLPLLAVLGTKVPRLVTHAALLHRYTQGVSFWQPKLPKNIPGMLHTRSMLRKGACDSVRLMQMSSRVVWARTWLTMHVVCICALGCARVCHCTQAHAHRLTSQCSKAKWVMLACQAWHPERPSRIATKPLTRFREKFPWAGNAGVKFVDSKR